MKSTNSFARNVTANSLPSTASPRLFSFSLFLRLAVRPHHISTQASPNRRFASPALCCEHLEAICGMPRFRIRVGEYDKMRRAFLGASRRHGCRRESDESMPATSGSSSNTRLRTTRCRSAWHARPPLAAKIRCSRASRFRGKRSTRRRNPPKQFRNGVDGSSSVCRGAWEIPDGMRDGSGL